MANSEKNKLAARILRAEMSGDHETVSKLKIEAAKLDDSNTETGPVASTSRFDQPMYLGSKCIRNAHQTSKRNQDGRLKRFTESNNPLNKMFVGEKNVSSSDETKIFMKLSGKFCRDDMETKHFSREIDDSQLILSKTKILRPDLELETESLSTSGANTSNQNEPICDRCFEKQDRNRIIDRTPQLVYLSLYTSNPLISNTISDIIVRNKDHYCDSFVSSGLIHQAETERLVDKISYAWRSKGYRCVIMETHFRNRRPSYREYVSCGGHFQIHCLPIKEKHLERARMFFKQALQSSEKEWSMNIKFIKTDGRKIQRYLPKGLSYFWVCFDTLDNGFGHVIEDEHKFSRYFGLEILFGLLDKDFNPKKMLHSSHENTRELFERCRNSKILLSASKSSACPPSEPV